MRDPQSLGADVCLNYSESPLAEQCQAQGVMGEIDVVLDMVGGDFEQFNLECLAVDGRIACIGLMRGGQSTIDLTQLLMKRATLTGSTLRRLTPSEKARCFEEVEAHMMPLVATGAMKPLIDRPSISTKRWKHKRTWLRAVTRANSCSNVVSRQAIASGQRATPRPKAARQKPAGS